MSNVYIDLIETLTPKYGDNLWATSDDEETWNKNQKNLLNRKKLEDLGWKKNSILYTCDRYHFRNSFDISTEETYTLFLGDSYTFGIGLNENQVWTSHVADYLGKPCYNAARPGYGIDSCYRILKYFLNQGYRFDNVFLFSPTPSRIEIYDDFEKKWMTVAWWTHYKKDLINKLNHEYFTTVNFDKTLDAIENLCNKNSLQLYHLNTENDCDDILVNDITARDLQHAGPDAHVEVANMFIKLYENNKV